MTMKRKGLGDPAVNAAYQRDIARLAEENERLREALSAVVREADNFIGAGLPGQPSMALRSMAARARAALGRKEGK